MTKLSLVFRAGTALCALELEHIVETMRPLVVTPVAGTPGYVPGVCVMRGVPVPVVDVAELIGAGAGAVSRFVAVRGRHSLVAFAVGEVLGIQDVGPPPGGDHAPGPGEPTAPAPVVTAIGTIGSEPLLFLGGAAAVPDRVRDAMAAGRGPG